MAGFKQKALPQAAGKMGCRLAWPAYPNPNPLLLISMSSWFLFSAIFFFSQVSYQDGQPHLLIPRTGK